MDEIAYRPRNVREILVELKNTSELAVDLAYAAALYGQEDLAREVHELESRANSLQYPAKISLMLAAKRADEAERLVGIIQIVDAAVDITNAAGDIASVVLDDVGLPTEVRAALPEADEVVVRANADGDSAFIGKTLGELSLETETGVHIVAIRRGDEWMLSPGANVVIHEGDVLIGSGPNAGIAAVYEQVTGDQYTQELASQEVVGEVHRAATTIIKLKDISELAVGLGYGAVLFNDGDLSLQVRELEAQSDSLTHDIQSWVIEAGEHVDDPSQLRGLLHLATASEKICDAALDVAEIVLRDGEVHPVFGQAVRESDEVITTTRVAGDSNLVGSTLATLELEERSGMAVMAIGRDDDWILAPTGENQLKAGDVLIARGPADGARQLKKQARNHTDAR